jgi:gas vesicle protein
MKTGKVFLGILAGIAAGATLGILLAPDKGSETRKKIYQKGDSYVGGLEDKWSEFVEDMTKKFDKVRKEANGMVASVKTEAAEMEKELADAAKARMSKNTM